MGPNAIWGSRRRTKIYTRFAAGVGGRSSQEATIFLRDMAKARVQSGRSFCSASVGETAAMFGAGDG